jgi:hypothetical protein
MRREMAALARGACGPTSLGLGLDCEKFSDTQHLAAMGRVVFWH